MKNLIATLSVVVTLLISSQALAQTCQKPIPNMLLILDKSGSMKNAGKWTSATLGIARVVKKFDGQVRFGLMSFADEPSWELDFGSPLSSFEAKMSKIEPVGETYMKKALVQAIASIKLALSTPSERARPTYVLLMTDGAPTDTCPVEEIKQLRKLDVGGGTIIDIRTFVIGFGSSVNPTCLNNLATFGGTANGSTRAYIVASTANELEKALEQSSNTAANSEVCNGRDDDCDGSVDNAPKSTKPLVQICRVGLCGGAQFCVNGSWGACQLIKAPSKEVCNFQDDDCDGYIDNIPGSKKPYTLSRECKDNCGGGVQTCYHGKWTACVGKSKVETCNNQDDDCDGTVDEDVQRFCGKCGVQRCERGRWLACQDRPKVEETCNGLDDDCDGVIDNAKGNQRAGSLQIACKNECNVGVQRCVKGKLTACDAPAPSKEICDGKDNDCNGVIDDPWQDRLDPSGNSCQTSCVKGSYQCKADHSDVYCAGVGENEEICDGLDNDCNGQVDERWGNIGRVCTVGSGACRQFGKISCTADKKAVFCDAPRLPKPTAEVCDGLDNDCDGKTDEELQRSCKHFCGGGVQHCLEGKWSGCKRPADSDPAVCEPNDPNALNPQNMHLGLQGCLCSADGSFPPAGSTFFPMLMIVVFLLSQTRTRK